MNDSYFFDNYGVFGGVVYISDWAYFLAANLSAINNTALYGGVIHTEQT